MLSESDRGSLSDILFNIDLANSSADGLDYAGFPWRKVSGAGNIYRHDYEDVAHRLVWGTVHAFLPALRAMVEAELADGE